MSYYKKEKRVKQLRIENNKIQEESTKYSGVDKSTYSKYESC